MFKLKVGRHLSQPSPQEGGVPQGSVLSATLFAVTINNVIDTIPLSVSKLLYMNDLTIYYTSNNVNHLERKLQLALNKVYIWIIS